MKLNKFISACFFICIANSFNANAQDIDQDGIADNMDNCKFTYNPTQEDTDGDGIGNSCDCEPTNSNPQGQHIPAIIISANPSGAIEPGTLVNFSSVIDAGGTNPIYQWKKNGNVVGTNNSSYSDVGLMDNDIILCELTSDVTCTSGNKGISNTILISVTSGNDVETVIKSSEVIIFPNPTKDFVTISSDINLDILEVLDINGRKVIDSEVKENKINLEVLNNGVYFLKIKTKDKIVIQKVIVKK